MSAELFSTALCSHSGHVFYSSVSMQYTVFLYSFCPCGLNYGECGVSISGCVEMLNLKKHAKYWTVQGPKERKEKKSKCKNCTHLRMANKSAKYSNYVN
jgi:Pyruvate/2-oxoacid:ferredoxin oxidoreductase delta subunit